MDSKFFRLPTKPNYYESVTNAQSECVAKKTIVSERDTVPSRDSRFPGFAAPMEDGRLVTDYRPHCNENIPAGLQYATKEWVQENTDGIIEVSRARQARITGAIYGTDPTTTPPPVGVVQCKPTECYVAYTEAADGIGIERPYDKAPELFGTFVFPRMKAPAPHVAVTTRFEGGRNTIRGGYFKDMGTAPVAESYPRNLPF